MCRAWTDRKRSDRMLDAVTRPLLAQPARGIRAEDPNCEVDHTTDDRDLDRKKEQPGYEAENSGKDAEEKLEHEQARKRKEPDHEDGAEHSWVLQTRTEFSYAAPAKLFQMRESACVHSDDHRRV